jgi:hypothetical protein
MSVSFCVVTSYCAVDSEVPQTFTMDDGVTQFPYLVMGNPNFDEVRFGVLVEGCVCVWRWSVVCAVVEMRLLPSAGAWCVRQCVDEGWGLC